MSDRDVRIRLARSVAITEYPLIAIRNLADDARSPIPAKSPSDVLKAIEVG